MNEKNPMDQIAVLAARVSEVMKDLGLDVEGFAVVPAHEGGPHMAQVIMRLDPEVAFVSAEQRQIDEQFRTIALQEQRERDENRFEQIRSQAQQSLKMDRGIGLDDD